MRHEQNEEKELFGARLAKLTGSAQSFPASFPPAARKFFWLFLAFAAAFLAYPGSWLYPADPARLASFMEHLAALGRPLLHGLPPGGEAAMPLAGVAALAAGGPGLEGLRVFWTLISLLLVPAGYGLGCLLAGRAAGVAAAAALFAGQGYAGFFDAEQRFYCLLLTLTAAAVAAPWASARARLAAETAVFGLGFLARQSLCWFPPLLALARLPFEKGQLRGRLLRAALAALLPFLFLLPWVKFNLAADRGFMLFDGKAGWNMVTGALGLASTFEGDYRRLAGLDRQESAALWALGRVARHPADYAAGVGRRAAHILRPHAPLLLLWLGTAALLRRRRNFAELNLLAAYFLAAHLAFSSEPRYFAPLFPLLAALTAAGLLALAGAKPAPAGEGLAAGGLAAAPLFAAGGFCLLLLLAHPGADCAGAGPRLDAALERSPGDAWLLREKGRLLLRGGDYAGAYAALGRAAVAAPGDTAGKLDLALAALLRNRRGGRPGPGSDLAARLGGAGAESFSFRPGKERALLALRALDLGDARGAAAHAAAAAAARAAFVHFKLESDSRLAQAAPGLNRDPYLVEVVLPELLGYFPPTRAAGLGSAFFGLYLADPANPAGQGKPAKAACPRAPAPGAAKARELSDAAVALITGRDLRGAAALLERAAALDPENFQARMNLCYLAGRRAAPGGHCDLAVFLAAVPPAGKPPAPDALASAFYSRGDFLYRSGRKAAACADLRRAREAAAPGWDRAGGAAELLAKACAGR